MWLSSMNNTVYWGKLSLFLFGESGDKGTIYSEFVEILLIFPDNPINVAIL